MYLLNIKNRFETQSGGYSDEIAISETLEIAVHYAKPFIENGYEITIEKVKENKESEAE